MEAAYDRYKAALLDIRKALEQTVLSLSKKRGAAKAVRTAAA